MRGLGRNTDLLGGTFSVMTEAMNACLDAGDTHSPGCRALLDRRDEIDRRQYFTDLPLMIEIGARVCPDQASTSPVTTRPARHAP